MTDLPDLKIKALVNFPATIKTSAPVVVTKQNGAWTIGLDPSVLAVIRPPAANLPNTNLLTYDAVSKAMALLNVLSVPLNQVRSDPVLVNFNAGNTDTPIVIPQTPGFTRWRLNNAWIAGASGSLTTATAGLFSAAGGGGVAISPLTALTINTAAENTPNNIGQLPGNATLSLNFGTVYFRVATPQGAPATAFVYLHIAPVP